ncbi:Sec-independent protein translocase subunit TatA [Phytoactinopolyspora mesophila]|uniref:Sec-independent protein translocase protein TatA n=1 Tax=Phytoactinopolyspora mesophila TaxID=2650750 RepID=A0A7K3M0W5_9ACTN|nr:Sec-independent protein translocase subunit TatA [Phytoactinopolyspora mesophila]NDL56088.1 twin-arginine translocase TatA/TatE family subunit [Phytoactinopolyspora mesophila]
MGNIGTWQLVIVAAVVLLLFGAKRLPEAARGLGRSLKIFKAETKGLIDDDSKKDDDSVVTEDSAPAASSESNSRAVEPTKVETPSDRVNEPTRES